TFAAVFGLLLGPEFTVFGVPMEAATATLGVPIPTGASTLRIFAGGPSLGVFGPIDPNDTTTWGDRLPGVACTVLLNYGLTMFLMAAGAAASLSLIEKAALPLAASIVTDEYNFLSDAFRNQDFSKPDVWKQLAVTTMKAFLAAFATAGFGLARLISIAMAEGV